MYYKKRSRKKALGYRLAPLEGGAISEADRKKVTIRDLQEMKERSERIVALGVYDSPMAAWADAVGFEIFVIGNSGPMSLFGHKGSTTVKPDELLFMTRAVSRVTEFALIVATMPYMSYVASREEAVRTAAWLVSEGGADCVQCHGNLQTAEFIAAITGAGVPVYAHLGLQSVRKTEQSGYGAKGKNAHDAKRIVDEARAMVDAGVFAIMLEHVPVELTQYIRDLVPVPVISLGSGPEADGIYLVSADLVGYSVFRKPVNAGQFADVKPVIEEALQAYASRVRAGQYPTDDQTRHMGAKELDDFKKLIEEV